MPATAEGQKPEALWKGCWGSRIQLPKEILCVYEGEESEASAEFRKKPKLLVYVDSVNCGECQISKFYRFEEIREEGI